MSGIRFHKDIYYAGGEWKLEAFATPRTVNGSIRCLFCHGATNDSLHVADEEDLIRQGFVVYYADSWRWWERLADRIAEICRTIEVARTTASFTPNPHLPFEDAADKAASGVYVAASILSDAIGELRYVYRAVKLWRGLCSK